MTSRGNAQASIFLDDIDRNAFLSVLGLTMRRFNVICHAYCLMTNHFHLLLETPNANLSKAMRQFNSVFTQAFNRRHGRVGHVLQGRFKSIVVDRDAYLLELCRYIVLNPVRAGMVKEPGKYPWSSYRATAGLYHGKAGISVGDRGGEHPFAALVVDGGKGQRVFAQADVIPAGFLC